MTYPKVTQQEAVLELEPECALALRSGPEHSVVLKIWLWNHSAWVQCLALSLTEWVEQLI